MFPNNPIAENTVQLVRNNWTATIGNYCQYVYYTGILPENPSGSLNNLRKIEYYNGLNQLVFSVQYDYDLSDRVVKERSF